MAHLTLQLGAALVVPFAAPRRMVSSGPNWLSRAVREAALAAAGFSERETQRRIATAAFTAHRPAALRHDIAAGEEIRS